MATKSRMVSFLLVLKSNVKTAEEEKEFCDGGGGGEFWIVDGMKWLMVLYGIPDFHLSLVDT
jgi:hypothetical protein